MIKHYILVFLSLFLFSMTASAQAVDDNVSTDQNTAIDIYVIFNDVTSGGLAQEPLVLVTQPTNGVAMVLDGGTPNDMTDDYITYIPNANYNGADSFVYQITTIEMVTSTATVYITVIPPATGGDPPVASDDMASTSEDMPVTIAVLSNDFFGSDGPGSGSITIVTQPSGGNATVNDNGTPNDPTDDSVTYTPEPNFTGNDLFMYTITDYDGDTSTATVTIEVIPDSTGDGPSATDDFATLSEDGFALINVLANDSFGSAGAGTGPITVTPQMPEMTAMGGMIAVLDNGTPEDPTDDMVSYSANLDITGIDSFSYTITDANGNAATATVIVDILPEPGPPVAVDDAVNTGLNTAIEIDVLANDSGINQLYGISIQEAPTHGATVINENTPGGFDNTITYTPEAGFTGEDSFVYKIFGNFGMDYGTVLVIVGDSGLVLKAFFDANGDGIQDPSEPDFSQGVFHYEINNNSTVYDAVSSTGHYLINEANIANTYDLSYSINNNLAAFYTVATPTYQDVSITPSQLTYFKFAVTGSAFADVSVQLMPTALPRPGFTHLNIIAYHNNAAQPVSGTLTFNHDATVTISSISQGGTTNIANGFTYDFSDLGPFETRYFTVGILVPVIPNVALGDLLTNTLSVSVASDAQPNNNTSSLTQTIVGSYDPNDITESHGEQIVYSEFTSEDYLTYTIRFENTGTANAENIRVENTLDEQLDEGTIEMVDASEDYTMGRTGSSLVWNFEDVQLPPSEENTQVGHGYLTYRIKPKPGYEIGDIIPNSAEIYFDFNPAIVTNTFNTEFVTALSIGDIENNTLSLYPNPVKNRLNINSKEVIQNVMVYNLFGQQVLEEKMNAVSGILDVSGLGSGVYLVRVQSAEAEKTIRIIKE